VLYGVNRPNSGVLLVDGTVQSIHSPADARRFGIGMVFQDLRLVPALTVAENIALATDTKRYRRRAVERRVDESAQRYGLTVRANTLVRDLSLAQRQHVEILKVLMGGARVVILDEPTSALAPPEVDALCEAITSLRASGLSVVMITHKLAEARALSDRVSVLRAGKVVVNGVAPADMDDDALVHAMVGRSLAPVRQATALTKARHDDQLALDVRDLSVSDHRGGLALHDVTLTVAKGELVGVAGVAGSGQRELYEAILGLRPFRSGSVTVSDAPVTANAPRSARAAGVYGMCEDPLNDEVVPGLDVLRTFGLGDALPQRGPRIDWATARDRALARREFDQLRVAHLDREVASLSGGNVQRVFYARALASPAKLLVLAYPSRGLDIATVRTGWSLIRERCDQGAGVLMMSEDLDELMELCDRIVVLHHGRVVGSVPTQDASRHQLGQLMLGAAA
jgi:general nucleoside transport system ATP-binding protein